MNNVIRLLLGFLVGGVCVAATTIIAERHGSRLGGFIGGLPSTLAIALLFVALTGGKDLAIQAAGISPLAFGISGLFVQMFVALSRYGFFWSMGLSLTAWVAAQSAIVIHGAPTLRFSVVAWVVCFCICWLGFTFGVKVKAQSSSGTSSNFEDFLIRPSPAGCSLRWRRRPPSGAGRSSAGCWPLCPWCSSARSSLPTTGWAFLSPVQWPVPSSLAPSSTALYLPCFSAPPFFTLISCPHLWSPTSPRLWSPCPSTALIWADPGLPMRRRGASLLNPGSRAKGEHRHRFRNSAGAASCAPTKQAQDGTVKIFVMRLGCAQMRKGTGSRLVYPAPPALLLRS